MIFLEILLAIAGCFLMVWNISLRRLSSAQRPRFSLKPIFLWGVLVLGGSLAMTGFTLAFDRNMLWAGLSLAFTLVLGWLVLEHDQYSAMMRILYDDYLTLKRQNPGSSEFDLLFSIVKSHYPRWSEDRKMEICVGKDIKQLVLLLVVLEYEIHPLNDMPLYERLKTKAEALAPQG
jgi:multidrug transporter EmrE-like cation transporter